MRITGGIHKSRVLYSSQKKDLRATSDKVRESLFNILKIPCGCIFFDLFAGSGSVGLEALSRGAHIAVFIESNTELLKKNIGLFSSPSLKVVRGFLPKILKRIKGQADYIFLDPPFEHPHLIHKTLEVLKNSPHLYKKDTYFIVQQSQYNEAKEHMGFQLLMEKIYSTNRLLFYKRNSL